MQTAEPQWSASEALEGASILITGTTGFLGKVFASMLLRYHPDVEQVYLVIRSRSDRSARERFEVDIAGSPAFDPIREIYGEAYDEFIDETVTVLDGDITSDHLGLDEAEAREIAEDLDLMVNSAGLTNFNPNLESALSINTLSQRRFLEFADLADDPPGHLHVSTAFVAGNRSGPITETFPDSTDYPRYDELGVDYDAEREIDDCLSMIDHAEALADDQERQSDFAARARESLREEGVAPSNDEAFDREYDRIRRRWLRDHLSSEGLERAEHWGWPNIYTYTKSLGERVLANHADEFDVCIARPAIIESSVSYPEKGWIEGVNTSGPLSYIMFKGHRFIPVQEHMAVDLIPVDFVAGNLIAIAAGMLEDRTHDVYHIGSSDRNPLESHRLVELTQLGNRRAADQSTDISTLEHLMAKTSTSVPVERDTFFKVSAPALRRAADGAKSLLDSVPTDSLGGLGSAIDAVKGGVEQARQTTRAAEKFFEMFIPFICDNAYVFESQHIEELTASMPDPERQRYGPRIDELDWRDYWARSHMPALAETIYPRVEEKLKRSSREAHTYETLLELFEAGTVHHEEEVALQHHDGGIVERYTYAELDDRADRAARLLRSHGVEDDVPVLLASENRPQWGMAYFGILRAGGIAVPVDPDSTVEEFVNFIRSSRARAIVLSSGIADDVAEDLSDRLADKELPATILTLDQLVTPALEPAEAADGGTVQVEPVEPEVERDWEPKEALMRQARDGSSIASLIYTSGTTGEPKGVMLTHENFTNLLSNLESVFDIDASDEFVSVLPLHHTFEFTCGFLLPLSKGATVTYLEELSGEELTDALQTTEATALVGVPALWELLYRRIQGAIDDAPEPLPRVLRWLQNTNRSLRETVGLDIGSTVFQAVHRALGGNLRYLVSGGAALPGEILEGFYGLGFDLYEGYGLTEASPVLTVNRPDEGLEPGSVGRPLPEIEIEIDDPGEDGVGEIVARGPNVMEGYLDLEAKTDEVLDDGWLRTGDVGRIDSNGRLEIVGREKEVVVTSGGENVYPDELEDYYGEHEAIDELSIVGLPDDSGSERVACLVRPDVEEEAGSEAIAEAQDDIREWFRVQGSRTASHKRVRVLRFWYEDFPRTATRKIQRSDVVDLLEEMLEAERAEAEARADDEDDSEWAWLHATLARLADTSPDDVHGRTHLYEDLGFDSLMFVELASILENRGYRVSAEQLGDLQTVEDMCELLGDPDADEVDVDAEEGALVETEEATHEQTDAWNVPPWLAGPGKELLGMAQMSAYENLFDVEVRGRSHIPRNNPNIVVVANHCSHLDMGLVKYALGDYGKGIRALAAADYFFGTPGRKTYFQHFTNLVPVERSGSLREALREANRALERGQKLLIFPEGTRSTDGKIHDFQSGLGYLVSTWDVDVLPLYLDGTYEALPKGQSLPSPTQRNLGVQIGSLRRAEDLEAATDAFEGREQFDAISHEVRETVLDLRDQFHRTDEAPDLAPLFAELTENFDPTDANGEASYYFSLGDIADQKWSVVVDGEECRVQQGKPDGGRADCVVKTSPDMFHKIVREGYTPSMDEFLSGDIKTNDPDLLRDFQATFIDDEM